MIKLVNSKKYTTGQKRLLKYKSLPNGWTLVTTSAWKNTQNSTTGGIGMLINTTAYQSLNNIESINKRII